MSRYATGPCSRTNRDCLRPSRSAARRRSPAWSRAPCRSGSCLNAGMPRPAAGRWGWGFRASTGRRSARPFPSRASSSRIPRCPSRPAPPRIPGWSPFEPGDADNSSLPVAGLEYTFTNAGDEELDAVFSFHARNFVPAAMNEWQSGPEPARAIRGTPGGFTLYGAAWPSAQQEEAVVASATDDPAAKVNLAWFRVNWFDPQTMAWRDVEQGAAYDRPAPAEGRLPTGASLFVPFHFVPGAIKTIRLRIAWYAPRTRLRDIVPPLGDAGAPSDY